MTDDWREGGFGLYLHWPFCQAKCPYCDFNSHVAATIDQDRWKRAYLSEIERVGLETKNRVLDTVFFGGGTPSMMQPDLIAAVLEKIRATWSTSNSFEVTLEANPTSAEAGRFRAYREAGVNRLSMGIQALNDIDLRALGRLHTVAEARAAFEMARNSFDRISFDLIYARQNQSLDDWKAELRSALEMAVDHLSLYQLTIEDGTAFGDRFARGRLRGLPVEDTAADMYVATQEVCEASGLPGYEISNHARPGAESRHNRIYWNCGDYIGIGPGAHGRLTLNRNRLATDAPKQPGAWLSQVETTGTGDGDRSELSPMEQLTEFLMMGLRLREGVSLKRLSSFPNAKLLVNSIKYLSDIDTLESVDGQLRATASGRLVLNSVLSELCAALPEDTQVGSG